MGSAVLAPIAKAGVGVVGPHFSEARVLATAHAFQCATHWHTRIPVGYA